MDDDDPWTIHARNQQALAEHPGNQAIQRWDEILRARNIFDRNADELVELLDVVESNRANQAKLFVGGDQGDQRFHDEFFTQLDQRLHNFVPGS